MLTVEGLINPSHKDRAEWERVLLPWTLFFDAVGCKWEPSNVLGASVYIPHLQLTFTAFPSIWMLDHTGLINKWAYYNSRAFSDAFAFCVGFPDVSAEVSWYGNDITDSSGGWVDDVGYWYYCTGKGLTISMPMMSRASRDIVDGEYDVIEAYGWAREQPSDTLFLLEGIRNSVKRICHDYYNPAYKPSVNTKPTRANNPVSKTQRFLIFKRDNYRCQICGRTAQDGATLEVDHKIPRAKGGTNKDRNLWTLCFDCNRGKRDKPL